MIKYVCGLLALAAGVISAAVNEHDMATRQALAMGKLKSGSVGGILSVSTVFIWTLKQVAEPQVTHELEWRHVESVRAGPGNAIVENFTLLVRISPQALGCFYITDGYD